MRYKINKQSMIDDSIIQIFKTRSFEISLTNTAAGIKIKKEGMNKLATVCDHILVSPVNVFLSIMNPTKQYNTHKIKGEIMYNKFNRRFFKFIFYNR